MGVAAHGSKRAKPYLGAIASEIGISLAGDPTSRPVAAPRLRLTDWPWDEQTRQRKADGDPGIWIGSLMHYDLG
jgi:hypothetical protein